MLHIDGIALLSTSPLVCPQSLDPAPSLSKMEGHLRDTLKCAHCGSVRARMGQ